MVQFSAQEIDGGAERKTARGCLLNGVHALAVAASTVLVLYWAFFTLDTYPWIVPADHNSEYVAAYAHAAQGGFIMMLVSLAGIVMATGVLARTYLGWGLSAFLLGCVAVASIGLYSQLDGMQLSPVRLPAQLLGLAVLALGAMGRRLWRGRGSRVAALPPAESERGTPNRGNI